MKPPITYYGGKQKLVSRILPLIPEHNLYCDPFLGEGAIYFSMDLSAVEVINDTNQEIINFYRQIKDNFNYLEKMINISLHSRDLHRQTKLHIPVKRIGSKFVNSKLLLHKGVNKS